MVQQSSIPSRALDVWRRLYTRYSLEPGPASVVPDVSKTIVPVTQADELLRAPDVRTVAIDLSGSAGAFVQGFLVPATERWTTRVIKLSGTVASSRIVVRDAGGTGVHLTAAATAEAFFLVPLLLTAGFEVGALATGNGGDSAETLQVLIEVEAEF